MQIYRQIVHTFNRYGGKIDSALSQKGMDLIVQ